MAFNLEHSAHVGVRTHFYEVSEVGTLGEIIENHPKDAGLGADVRLWDLSMSKAHREDTVIFSDDSRWKRYVETLVSVGKAEP